MRNGSAISSVQNPFKPLVLAPLRSLEQLYSPWVAPAPLEHSWGDSALDYLFPFQHPTGHVLSRDWLVPDK